jgi:threonine/homoserine/homoserine lactone efflux protein
MVNALSPHPYLFWIAVGVPTIIKASYHSYLTATLFVIAFFLAIVGSKMAVALAVDRSRGFLSSALYLWLLRGLGLCLIGFAGLLLLDGLDYLGLH